MIIDDGSGKGYQLKIDGNRRAHTQSVTESENLHATATGDSFNLGTGLISFSANGTLMYIKNNEDEDFIVDTIVVGLFEGITHSDDPYITIISNPTGGNLISDASALASNANRNLGSSKTFTADLYKGKSSGTVTGGDTFGIIQITPASRTSIPLNISIPRGKSVAISLTLNASSGSANGYCAVIGYLKDPENAD